MHLSMSNGKGPIYFGLVHSQFHLLIIHQFDYGNPLLSCWDFSQ